MKNFLKILFVCFFGLTSFAQQATEIDPKSVRLPRYTNLTAIQSAITSPQQGMMVYNVGTATNWYYNGSNWTNLATATSAPTEAEGFGSWGCSNASLIAYQPVGNFDGQNSDYFGRTTAISGDYAIVGANRDDEGFTDNGSATIFKRNSGTGVWESQGKLTNPASAIYDNFGFTVAISGDYAIVGAYADDEGGFTDNGSATIFKRNSGIWQSQGKLTDPNPANSDYFGFSVGISGDYAIVGAYTDDEGFTDNGSATIFKRNSGTGVWESQGKLTNAASAISDHFGYSVAISGDYAIVAAYLDDEGFVDNGSATIFKRNSGTGWRESQGKLTNPVAAANDYFGYSVAISGDYAIVAAYADDEGGFTENGSATIYRRYGNVWRNLPKTSDPSAANYDYFGASVAIDGSTARLLIGALGSSSSKGLAVFGQVK